MSSESMRVEVVMSIVVARRTRDGTPRVAATAADRTRDNLHCVSQRNFFPGNDTWPKSLKKF